MQKGKKKESETARVPKKIDSFRDKYFFLSNFYDCKICYEDEYYASVEHAFQAAKTYDLEERKKVQRCHTPGQAKREGSRVTRRADWDTARVGVMKELVLQKFSTKAELKDLLLETGEAHLIEGNGWGDTFWGVSGGKGENHLGKILMEVRQELQTAKS